MIQRDTLIDWLRGKNFHFHNRTLRNELYRKGQIIIAIPTASGLKDGTVRGIMTQSQSATVAEIDQFVAANKK